MDPFFANEVKPLRILYRNVSNAVEVRKHIYALRLPLCLLKPSLIVDEFQLSIAISKALHNQRQHTMTTKSFPTELIYCLSPSRNINESLRTFGTGEGDTDVLIVADPDAYTTSGIEGIIRGDKTGMVDLHLLTNEMAVMELYQITSEELSQSSLLNSVITKMATKDYQL